VDEDTADTGIDTVNSSVDYSLDAGVENLTLLGSDDLEGDGNELDNIIFGNEGDNDLSGATGDDEVYGEVGLDDISGGSGNDDLFGGAKSDSIFGGNGKDFMTGDGGADDFVYTKTAQSGTTGATRDQLLDFGGTDDIDLSAIDAVKGEAGNQAFSLDTNGDFAAGEIRIKVIASGVRLDMNVDADAQAEMSILLKDFTGTINNSDFVF
jgi:Ca2+-binding RTX toxin-like protein